MAFTNFVQFEIRSTGDDTNGGGFAPGGAGVDYSQQDSPQYAVTDAACASSFNITSATANFGTDVIGNICYFAGGTGSATPRWWQIVARPNNTTITVDTRGYAPGNTTGATLRIGGALASPGAFGQMFAQQPGEGMTGWLKAGTYTITNSTVNTSNGPIDLYSGSGFSMGALRGYHQTRGDSTGVRPVISAGSVSNIIMLKVSAYQKMGIYLRNIEIDGNNQANVTGTSYYANYGTTIIRDCIYRNCTTGINASTYADGSVVVSTQFIGCTTGCNALRADSCEAISCTTGFLSTTVRGFGCLSNCIARDCTTGFSSSYGKTIANCLAVQCGTGFSQTTANVDPVIFMDCIAALCTGRGWNIPYGINFNCASFSNGLANILPPTAGTVQSSWSILTENHITLSVNPFIDSTNNDFRLNNTANGGALLRKSGIILPSQSLKRQIGPVLYTDSGSLIGPSLLVS